MKEQRDLKIFRRWPLSQPPKKDYRSAFPSRRSSFVAFMEYRSRGTRLIALIALLITFYTLVYFDIIPLILLTNLAFLSVIIFFPGYFFKVQALPDPIRNMPAMLHREERGGAPTLRLGMEEAPLAVVKKVALSRRDETYGFIDFPYTRRIGSPLIFPVEQLDSVRQWLEENVPELELIE